VVYGVEKINSVGTISNLKTSYSAQLKMLPKWYVVFPMTLNDPYPQFQGHASFDAEAQKR